MGISLAPKETTWDPHTPNLPQVLLCCIECQPALVVPMETEPCDTLPNSRHKALARPFFFFFFSSQFAPTLGWAGKTVAWSCCPLGREGCVQRGGGPGVSQPDFQDRQGPGKRFRKPLLQLSLEAERLGSPGTFHLEACGSEQAPTESSW